ncbi:ARID DNA-binding domain-containing protein [Tanacetum coccineum]|uniref:ARID DNA-binding domain-containing protein n=1 Tax=Tanacetum coccineum TaxID=301880 RepID=A0ABQ5IKL4_9ASTR
MVNTNTFLENRWSRPSSSAYGLPNIWYQSKLGRPLRKKMQYGFIQRQLKREREARLGNCIRQITNDCKDMLRKKLEEIEMYNSTISQNRNRKQKCYKCRQRGHIIKNCPLKEKKQDEGTKKHDNTSVLMKGQESANLVNKELLTTKPTVSLKYPEWIHFSTKCMIKGTDQGHWDDIWYISNNTNMHLCSKLNLFCNIKESFAVNKLDDQMKFLFIYGIGEVVVKNGDQGYLIPGVHYAPEVTLNILSIEQLERQGFDIIYEDNTCRLSYMFSNPNDYKLNEDKLKVMQNEFLENYFDSLEKGNTTATRMKTDGMLSMDNDVIEIKGTTYSTKVNTFNEYVAFLNLLKQDEIISQEWDIFRNKFDKVVKWFYERYLEKPLPGPIPPKINGVTIHLMDLYKLVESFGGYLSVYFARDFGKIGEILGLSIQDGEEVRRCYINFLDVFTSYYKTARVPKQEHNSVLSMPTKNVGKGKEYTCPASHQCDFVEIQAPNMEAANRKGKEKIEHFGIILEDARKEADSHQLQPISPNIKKSQTMNKDLQGMIKRPMNSDKEDTNSSSSEDFTIIT